MGAFARMESNLEALVPAPIHQLDIRLSGRRVPAQRSAHWAAEAWRAE